jgi:type I restriction enzyme R subunit
MWEWLVELNRTRADFSEKFEELIESYNAGSRSIEALYQELLDLSNSLNPNFPLGPLKADDWRRI